MLNQTTDNKQETMCRDCNNCDSVNGYCRACGNYLENYPECRTWCSVNPID